MSNSWTAIRNLMSSMRTKPPEGKPTEGKKASRQEGIPPHAITAYVDDPTLKPVRKRETLTVIWEVETGHRNAWRNRLELAIAWKCMVDGGLN